MVACAYVRSHVHVLCVWQVYIVSYFLCNVFLTKILTLTFLNKCFKNVTLYFVSYYRYEIIKLSAMSFVKIRGRRNKFQDFATPFEFNVS